MFVSPTLAAAKMGRNKFVICFPKSEFGLAAVFAAGHDGVVEALADGVGQFVDFVRAIDLDCFASGAEGDLTMVASCEMLLKQGTSLHRDIIVDQFIEQR